MSRRIQNCACILLASSLVLWTLPAAVYAQAETSGRSAQDDSAPEVAKAKAGDETSSRVGETSTAKTPSVVAGEPIPDIIVPVEEVRSALRGDPSLRGVADNVHVRVDGITFFLEGTVPSESARKGVLIAVKQVARTFRVQDRMTVRK